LVGFDGRDSQLESTSKHEGRGGCTVSGVVEERVSPASDKGTERNGKTSRRAKVMTCAALLRLSRGGVIDETVITIWFDLHVESKGE
jgi:hypothetical protein